MYVFAQPIKIIGLHHVMLSPLTRHRIRQILELHQNKSIFIGALQQQCDHYCLQLYPHWSSGSLPPQFQLGLPTKNK